MAKYCQNCGNVIKEGENYCSKCNFGYNTNIATNKSNGNGIAIAGFICSMLGLNIIGLILSILGISNAKKCNGNNRGLAIAGLIISIIRLVISIIIIFIFFFMPLVENEINEEWEEMTNPQYESSYNNNYYAK